MFYNKWLVEILKYGKKIAQIFQFIIEDKHKELKILYRIDKIYRKNNEPWIRSVIVHSNKVFSFPAARFLDEQIELLNGFKPTDAATIAVIASTNTLPITVETQPMGYRFLGLLIGWLTSVLISANIMSSKMMLFYGIPIVAGAICFPLAYSISEIITEIYGFSEGRKAIFIAISANVLSVIFIELSIMATPDRYWHHQIEYAAVLGVTIRVFIASMTAFFVGDFINIVLFAKIKLMLAGKFLWFRLVISSAIGFLIDSIIFLAIAQINFRTLKEWWIMVYTIFLHKFIYEFFASFIVMLIIYYLKPLENLTPLTNTFRTDPKK